MTLNAYEERYLRALAEHGSIAATAKALGRHPQTVKNALTIAYRTLGVSNSIQAFKAMGWLSTNDPAYLLVDALAKIADWTKSEPSMSGEHYPNMLNRERINRTANDALDKYLEIP